jgi:glyoxylase-like metal-dependent hydrolase (beta-lactamase superfamily II)/rhodanese-related sulfurtransferase
MKIEQIYTGCLAQGAYYVVSENEAFIIDPLREIEPYLERLKRDNVQLKYVFETHFHADFVSGHIDLNKATGADIVYGPLADPGFDAIIATDNQEFKVGRLTVKVLHTPGHTMESSIYLLKDDNGKDHCIFTGDTLFLGDVGRPDLAQKAAHLTQEDLAGMLYESLYKKVLPLADELIVYPAHGAGSACGKNMMKETVDSLGNQKKMNYALNQPDKASFIKAVTDGLSLPPAYFPQNVGLNKMGYKPIDEVLTSGLKTLSPTDFELASKEEGMLILDTRSAGEFSKGFIPGSINIGLNGDFAPWVGSLLGDVNQPLLLVCEVGKEAEAVTRLSRIGFDHVCGFLSGGFQSWVAEGKSVEKINRITTDKLSELYTSESLVIDVRKPSEFDNGHLANASLKPLAEINEWTSTLAKNDSFYLHCQGGYRSMIAASILASRGIKNFWEIEGGYAAIAKAESPAIILDKTKSCTQNT